MLTAIIAVTLSAPDLGATETAYTTWLGYKVVDRGLVSETLASSWGAPLTEGREFVLLQPASGAPTYLRIVQSAVTPGYAALKTHGWNANEILVKDPDALAARFAAADSPFRVIGPPRPLSSSSTVRAMQAIGPAGELNYFTRIPPEGGTMIKTPAVSEVDRTFIVVLGGADMSAMRSFYGDVLKTTVTPPYDTTVNVLQDAYGLPADHLTQLALVAISPGFLIELDQYPPQATARPVRNGDLPPGMAIVSFAAKDLDVDALPWAVGPTARTDAPYDGRRAGMLIGPAGEWIEVVLDDALSAP